MRKLAGIITPCQSKAAATRFMRSPPAAKNVATTSTTTKARTAKGSRSASRGIGVPALSVLAARRARSIWARHNATEYESSVGAAISSAIAVAGRCGKPELRSSRRRPSIRLGTRSVSTGANAAAVSRKKMPRPMARPAGGSQSHRPSHESARNRPMTVATDASAGHSRSQKIVQRARRSARASKSSPARSCAESWWGAAASAGRSVKSISRKTRICPDSDINTQLHGCQQAKGRHPLIKTSSAGYGSRHSRGVQKPRRQAVERDQVGDLQAWSHQRPFVFPHKHFRHQRAGVVSAGLDRAIGARGHDREQIAGPRRDHIALERQEIAGLADRPGNVGNDARGVRARLAHWTDVMVSLIERGTDEVIHPGIDDNEGLGLAALEIEHAR